MQSLWAIAATSFALASTVSKAEMPFIAWAQASQITANGKQAESIRSPQVSGPVVSKSFNPSSVGVGDTAQMTITLTNPTAIDMTGVEFTDVYPQGMVNSDNQSLINNCGGQLTATPNDTSAALFDGTIPAFDQCSVVIEVVATAFGTLENHTGLVTTANAGTGADASATLTVIGPPHTSLQFYPDSLTVGGTSKLVTVFTNTNSSPITGLQFTNNLPAGILIAASSGAINSCGGTLSAVPNGTSVSLNNGTIGANLSCVVSLNVVGTTVGSRFDHTGTISSANAPPGPDAGATLTVTSGALLSAPSISTTFTPASVVVGGYSQLSITLSNNDPVKAITGAQFGDVFPSGFVSAPNSIVVSNNCSQNAYPQSSSLLVYGATIPAAGSCTVVVNVVGASVGTWANQTGPVPSGNAQTAQGASASLTVTNGALLPATSAQLMFSPANIVAAGGTSDMSLTLINPNATAVTGVQYSQNYPPGIVNASSGVVVANACGGTLNAPAGGTSTTLSGATIPVGECTVTVRVAALWAGTYLISSGLVYSGNAGTGGPASATLTASNDPLLLSPPSVSKIFAPSTVAVGDSSQMTIALSNNNAVAITGAAFTDIYPPHIINGPGGAVNSCGGTVTALPNGSSAQLSGGTIPAHGSCSVVINVTATMVWSQTNRTGSVTSSNANPGTEATALLRATYNAGGLLSAPTVTKAFSPLTVPIGSTSQMTISLSNPNSSAITGLQFSDAYPSGMVNASSGAVISNSCGGSLTAVNSGTSVVLSGGTIPANAACSVVLAVGGMAAGGYVNHTGVVTSTNADFGADATATLTATNGSLLSAPTVTKVFAPTSVPVGGTSQMTITLANPNASAITGAQFSDIYPTPLHMANAPSGVLVSNSCGGSVTAAPNGTSAALSNGTIPANGACSVVVNVVGTSVGSSINQTGAVTSGNASSGNSASATLTITGGALLTAPNVAKAFMPTDVTVGGTSQMSITLLNPNMFNPITGVQFVDNYPAGMANASGNAVVSNSCGGTVTATPNGNSVAFANGTIPPNQGCIVRIKVVGTSAGNVFNHTGSVTSANAGASSDATATLNVTPGVLLPAPTIAKTFVPASITVGGASQLTMTLSNANPSSIVGAQVLDTYPAGMTESGYGVLSNTCGGFLDEYPDYVALANVTIPAQGSCSVVVQVTGTAAGSYLNQTSSLASSNASTGASASATLTVAPGALLTAPTVTKAFAPASVAVGGTSQMTITLNNPNSSAITGAQIFDSYPGPLHMANAPANVVVSNDCGGTVTATTNDALTVLANGTVPANGSCKIVINVVGTSVGSTTNHTGSVLSGNANSGADASATLTVTGGSLLNAPSATKAFAPGSVVVGGTSQMTITLTNPNASAITGVQFNDIYPTPLHMANAPSGVLVSNSCGGSVTAAPNGTSAALSNGTIPANGACSVVVNVIGTSLGSSINQTGAVTSGNALSGSSASGILAVTGGSLLAAPTVAKSFAPSSVSVGGTSQMTITLANSDLNTAVTGVLFGDTYPAGMANASSGAVVKNTCNGTVTATANGTSAAMTDGTIPAGGSCDVVINVVGTAPGSSVNHTGSVNSSNAQVGADASATLAVNNNPILTAPTATKTFTPSIVSIGGVSQMMITLTNPNGSAITGAQFNDAYPFGMASVGGVVVDNTCGGTPTVAPFEVSLVNGTVPGGGSCSVVVNVIGTAATSAVNHTGSVPSANALTGADATASLTVTGGGLLAAPTVSKAFAPTGVTVGGTSQMTITLVNPNGSAISGAQFVDTYPAHMANAASAAVVDNTCGGTVTAAASGTSAALSNGTIPASGMCHVVINVVGTSAGSAMNHTGAVLSANANAGPDATASLTVTSGSLLAAPAVTKVFAPTSVPVGGTSQMTITLTNPNGSAITGAQVNDVYPAGMANAGNPAVLSDTCNFDKVVPANGSWAKLANGTIPAGQSCATTINVIGTAVGTSINQTGAVLSGNAQSGVSANATLTVTSGGPSLGAPTATKAFLPASIMVGGTSQMTITLANPNASPITGAQVNDLYPAGMANADSNPVVSDTCNFTEDVPVSGSWAKLSTGTIPANGSCEVVINLVGTAAGNAINHTGTVTSTNADPGADASATLTVTGGSLLGAPTVTKTFTPASVTVGGTSQMTITLANFNGSAITGLQFTDNYPSGMANAGSGVVVSNTCGGALTAVPSGTSATLAGGTIPANSLCSVKINVIGTSVGSLVNHTGPVSSGNADPGADATATLTVAGGALLPAPTATKAFSPASVSVGDASQMTVTLSNPNATAITGAQFIDTYPAGMANASSGVVISNTCAGAVTAVADAVSTSLANGTIPANSSCSVVINVVGTAAGSSVNHTGSVPSANASAGADATATLTVNGSGANQLPIAVGDAVEVDPNGTATTLVGDPNIPSSLLDNDIDLDAGDTLTAEKLSDPAHGMVSVSPAGLFIYQNTSNANTDSFTYRACDNHNGCSAETTVTITIGVGLNNHVPYAVDDAIQMTAGSTADTLVGDPNVPSSVLDNDIDADGDSLTATKLADPAHGDLAFNADGSFTYHNTDLMAPSDSFLYQVCDSHGACDLGLVTITINNSPPNHPPVVVDDAIQVVPGNAATTLIGDLNVPSSVLDNDSDPDAGDVLTATKIGELLNGTGTVAVNADGTFTYQNTSLAAGTDSFLYEACDGDGACAAGTVTITITNNPPDSLPIAVDDAIVVAPNGSANTLVGDPSVPSSVLDNDSDPNAGDTLIAHLISPPSSGDIVLNTDGTFTYTNTDPNASSDALQYEACDSYGACVAATVSVTINQAAPTVTCVLPRQVEAVGDSVNLDLSMLFSPPAGQSLTFSATNTPASLSLIGSLLTGTLQANDVAGSPYTSTLKATTVPGGASASEDVIFQVLPTGEILLRDGFDGTNPPPLCM